MFQEETDKKKINIKGNKKDDLNISRNTDFDALITPTRKYTIEKRLEYELG